MYLWCHKIAVSSIRLFAILLIMLLYKLNADFDTFFETTSLEHKATGLATHTSTKTMNAGASTCLGLECSFWHTTSIVPQETVLLKSLLVFFDIYALLYKLIHTTRPVIHCINSGQCFLCTTPALLSYGVFSQL